MRRSPPPSFRAERSRCQCSGNLSPMVQGCRSKGLSTFVIPFPEPAGLLPVVPEEALMGRLVQDAFVKGAPLKE